MRESHLALDISTCICFTLEYGSAKPRLPRADALQYVADDVHALHGAIPEPRRLPGVLAGTVDYGVIMGDWTSRELNPSREVSKAPTATCEAHSRTGCPGGQALSARQGLLTGFGRLGWPWLRGRSTGRPPDCHSGKGGSSPPPAALFLAPSVAPCDGVLASYPSGSQACLTSRRERFPKDPPIAGPSSFWHARVATCCDLILAQPRERFKTLVIPPSGMISPPLFRRSSTNRPAPLSLPHERRFPRDPTADTENMDKRKSRRSEDALG